MAFTPKTWVSLSSKILSWIKVWKNILWTVTPLWPIPNLTIVKKEAPNWWATWVSPSLTSTRRLFRKWQMTSISTTSSRKRIKLSSLRSRMEIKSKTEPQFSHLKLAAWRAKSHSSKWTKGIKTSLWWGTWKTSLESIWIIWKSRANLASFPRIVILTYKKLN